MTSAEPIDPTDGEGAGWVRWRLGLRVEPLHGEPFAASASAELRADESPAIGGRVEVLHDPRPRSRFNWAARGGSIEPLLLGPPPVRGRQDPPPGEREDHPSTASTQDVVRALVEGLRDGSLASGLPMIVTAADDPEPPAAAAGGPLGALPLDELAACVGDDAPGAVGEVARRLRAGEATPAQMLRAASAAGLSPARIAAVAAAVAAGDGD